MGETVRAHVYISGRVQGVCYRMETRDAARRHNVTGWVKNKMDGSVEAVFEGDAENVHAIIEWCRQGPANALVRDVDIQWEVYTGEFREFDITF